ncbi:Ger(x)C family spore germination protein [Paenibacillus glycanilyticus]|uniref:Ger(x)C family spore germination protein n=1 Tax=Paenibacillus glycanilyticus TaxID=126569 RepID=UPI00203CAB07|nr:Ger(x)C family spore germination protein [Paenibacillus glycanilyticus]MCM3628314.1 Ger(x)C family spore germination protein [Paenibacillus glycanilyticus]
MKPFLRICLILSILLTSGCWDRTEINDLAFITGTAFDLTEKGEYLLSLQFAVPTSSDGGGTGEPQQKFFVLSATGKNANEAFEKIQKKNSRKLFTAHRSVILIGESLGRHGINDVLDVFSHDPRQRLKTYIMVVKGGEAQEVLQTRYPFDQVPMEAVKEMEIQRAEIATSLRDFFLAASSPGVYPMMGVIEAVSEGSNPSNKTNMFKLSGAAVFKDLKLVGLLDGFEADGLNWANSHMKDGRINAELPEGIGNVGMVVVRASRMIKSDLRGDRIHFKIILHGKGTLIENNTDLDVSVPKNLTLVQHALEKSAEKQIHNAILKLQKQFKADAIGLGRELYRNKPTEWKAVQKEWDQKFAEAEVTVDVKLTIGGAGMAGPPLQLNAEEILK